jgi:hypothetical protein
VVLGGYMLESIKRIWSGSDPVEFESAFGMQESVERLRAATQRRAFFPTKEVAAGAVTESRVSLQRVIPMVSNSFKPFFVGRFEQRGTKVFLVGHFTLNRLVKLFMGFWLFGVASISLTATLANGRVQDKLPFALVGIGMLLFATLLLRFGNWLSGKDPVWLSRVIREALGAQETRSSNSADYAALNKDAPSGKPWALTKMTLLLAIAGVALCISAATGVQSYYSSPGTSVVIHYHDIRWRYIAALLGMVFLVLSLGIYQKRLIAWRLVFWVFGAFTIMQVSRFFMDDGFAIPLPVRIVFCAVSLFVVAVWGRWWYAQREHFND